MNPEEKDFKTQFAELLHTYGGTVAKLADATGIPERYLELLHAGHFENLPPDPYIRGYLARIGNLTGEDIEPAWNAFKKESAGTKISGIYDRLPGNRFTLARVSKGKVFLAFLVTLALTYGASRFDVIMGNPLLTVDTPSEALVVSSAPLVLVRGEITPGDKLTINKESVVTRPDGSFESSVQLAPGLNIIEIAARRFLGRTVSLERRVLFTPQSTATSTTETSGGQTLFR